MQYGTVFNIQRFTIHDGPGMRTELFLKGCPLRCRWCSNPEGQSAGVRPGVYASRCIGGGSCGVCRKVCPQDGALVFSPGDAGSADRAGFLKWIDRSACINCMRCADACPADAIRRWGEAKSVSECMEVIRRDLHYYEQSGGGVTVSGGEPLLQSAFVRELFEACRAEHIHTCLESTMSVPWSRIEEVLGVTDLFISDLKLMDTGKHRQYTGAGNELILENLRKVSDRTSSLILRIPVIPGINDDQANISASADYILKDLGGRIESLQLLSFMFLGEEKYLSLGMPYTMHELDFDRETFQKHVEEIAEYFLSRGIRCTIGNRRSEKK